MSQQQFPPQGDTGGAGQQGMEYATGTQQGPNVNAAGPEQQFGGQQGSPMGGPQGTQMGGQQPSRMGGRSGSQMSGQQGYQSSDQQAGQQSIQLGGQTGGTGAIQQDGRRGLQQGGEITSRPMERDLEDALTGEMRLALHDFVQAATVCEWCADRCTPEGREMAECIRLCRDVTDLASLNAKFVARDSPFGPELAETFAYAAEECAQECARHDHHHCQECASVLRRAVDSTWQLLESIEGGQSTGVQQQAQQF